LSNSISQTNISFMLCIIGFPVYTATAISLYVSGIMANALVVYVCLDWIISTLVLSIPVYKVLNCPVLSVNVGSSVPVAMDVVVSLGLPKTMWLGVWLVP